jgi:hypothetical protein
MHDLQEPIVTNSAEKWILVQRDSLFPRQRIIPFRRTISSTLFGITADARLN